MVHLSQLYLLSELACEKSSRKGKGPGVGVIVGVLLGIGLGVTVGVSVEVGLGVTVGVNVGVRVGVSEGKRPPMTGADRRLQLLNTKTANVIATIHTLFMKSSALYKCYGHYI